MPLIAIEIVLVFGGALAFGWWQLRSIRKDQAKAAAKRAREEPADDSRRDKGEVEKGCADNIR